MKFGVRKAALNGVKKCEFHDNWLWESLTLLIGINEITCMHVL
jgi:hypothetical protein